MRFVCVMWLGLVSFAGAAYGDAWQWDHLIGKLVADGVDRARVASVFDDARIDPFTAVEFNPDRPRERRALYAGFRKSSAITAARHCRTTYRDAFQSAAKRFGVSADVIAAILFVETRCGRNSGSSLIFHRLARLAMANEPRNLQHNMDRYRDSDGSIDLEIARQLSNRALYLEQTFYPEVKALFEVADRMGRDPLSIRGSGSGAFGYPQFLPTSYLKFGVDADSDGAVDLYDVDDAAASCGRYLAAHGWHPAATTKQKRAAIWSYNHSEAYIDAVLGLATTLGKPVKAAKPKPKGKPRPKRQMAKRKQ